MTTTHETPSPPRTAADLLDDPRHRDLVQDMHWFLGSPLAGIFGGLLLDQVANPAIAAAVDHTGRFAANFTDRGVRSFAFGALMAFGDAADSQAFREELKSLHTEVKGSGKGAFEGTRYSALRPDLWIWVAVSSINSVYRSYLYLCGRRLDDEQKEVVYQVLRDSMSYLELPSKQGKLPATLPQFLEYYDRVAESDLADNEFLHFARANFIAPPPPTLMPRRRRRVLRPIWGPLMTVAARPTIVCSDRVCHPRMRELLGINRDSGLDRAEFALYVTLMRLAWRRLPRWLTLEPLAYNRYRYERLRESYRRVLLDSFAVPPERTDPASRQ
ncbi:MAG: DUF2236 domain-containing protein [Nocardia sp.]|nr:DUF2236 domain-containing protein [Nocardia sp.]